VNWNWLYQAATRHRTIVHPVAYNHRPTRLRAQSKQLSVISDAHIISVS